jgi:hypothetical protein
VAVRGVAAENLEEIEHNLEGLTMYIPDITLDELPRRYQRHIGWRFSIHWSTASSCSMGSGLLS